MKNGPFHCKLAEKREDLVHFESSGRTDYSLLSGNELPPLPNGHPQQLCFSFCSLFWLCQWKCASDYHHATTTAATSYYSPLLCRLLALMIQTMDANVDNNTYDTASGGSGSNAAVSVLLVVVIRFSCLYLFYHLTAYHWCSFRTKLSSSSSVVIFIIVVFLACHRLTRSHLVEIKRHCHWISFPGNESFARYFRNVKFAVFFLYFVNFWLHTVRSGLIFWLWLISFALFSFNCSDFLSRGHHFCVFILSKESFFQILMPTETKFDTQAHTHTQCKE